MIDQELLQDYLNGLDLGMPVYLNLFPEETQYAAETTDLQECMAFTLKTIFNKRVIIHSNLRCLIRANHPGKCMEYGQALIKALDYKTNVILGDTQIVLFQATDTTPVPLGVDNNNNNVYQVDILVVSSPLD